MEGQDLKRGLRRNHLQILAQVLVFCLKPQSKIRVMQHTTTSSRLVEKYLQELQLKGFLENVENRNVYLTTVKGKTFIEKWIEIERLLGLVPDPG